MSELSSFCQRVGYTEYICIYPPSCPHVQHTFIFHIMYSIFCMLFNIIANMTFIIVCNVDSLFFYLSLLIFSKFILVVGTGIIYVFN